MSHPESSWCLPHRGWGQETGNSFLWNLWACSSPSWCWVTGMDHHTCFYVVRGSWIYSLLSIERFSKSSMTVFHSFLWRNENIKVNISSHDAGLTSMLADSFLYVPDDSSSWGDSLPLPTCTHSGNHPQMWQGYGENPSKTPGCKWTGVRVRHRDMNSMMLLCKPGALSQVSAPHIEVEGRNNYVFLDYPP